MGTYAEYVVWAGLPVERIDPDAEIDAFGIFEVFADLLDSAEASVDGVDFHGTRLTAISMHGETVGLGVLVFSLSWTDKLRRANAFNPHPAAGDAQAALDALNTLFEEHQLPPIARLFHHLDLGV